MGALGRFVRGFRYGLTGLWWLRSRPSLARYWLPPVVLTAVLFVLLQAAAIRYFDELLGHVWQPPGEAGCADAAWWSFACLRAAALRVGYVLSGVLAWAAAAAAGVLLTFVLSVVIAAPFNDALSEAVERLVGRGEVPAFRLLAVLTDAARTVALEAGKVGIFLAVMAPLFVLSWLVPGAGQLAYTAVGGLLAVSYFALDFVDWPAARRGWSIRQRLSLLREQPALMLGFGSVVWVLLYIPVLNLFLMPAAVIGGTLLFLDLKGEKGASAGRASPGVPPGRPR